MFKLEHTTLPPVVEHTLPKPNRRSEMWRAIRSFKGEWFTRSHIQGALDWERTEVDGKYIKALIDNGFLEVKPDKPCRQLRLIRDVGIDAPRFTNNGELIEHPNVNEALWKVMRMLKQFTVDILVAHASTSYRQMSRYNTCTYVKFLKNAGYLQVTDASKFGKETFQLVRSYGSKAPQILHIKEVFDPNINQIVYREVPDAE